MGGLVDGLAPFTPTDQYRWDARSCVLYYITITTKNEIELLWTLWIIENIVYFEMRNIGSGAAPGYGNIFQIVFRPMHIS